MQRRCAYDRTEHKKRRKELKMTQWELAHKMGFESNSTISKIENNVNDVSQSEIIKFAEVLHIDVSELMDVSASPRADTSTELSDDEALMLDTYRKLSMADRMLVYAEALKKMKEGD